MSFEAVLMLNLFVVALPAAMVIAILNVWRFAELFAIDAVSAI